MPKIGEYTASVSRYPRALAAADATGEEVETWAAASPVQKHWAMIEAAGGSESTAVPRASGDAMRLRFRHLITLAAIDHVVIEETGDEYAVTGIWRERSECGGWQTVCSISGPV